MTVDFTVAIPTYNGANRLPHVLEKLRRQTDTEQISWELIIIDNNSTDETANVVANYQEHWLPGVALRYFFEQKQGITFARQRAIQEAEGNFIGFLDDDNLPTPNWVTQAYLFGQNNPQAGAYGGQTYGEFEVDPPQDFEKIKNFLVIRNYGNQPQKFEPEKLRLPAGAGLVVRKQAWLDSMPSRFVRTSRGGNDYEISLHLHKRGWEIWYNPAMSIGHKIPSWRMNKDYLLPLCRLYGLCTCELLMINAKNWQKPMLLVRSFLGNLRRLLQHIFTHRGRLKTELSVACEMEFFLGGLMSPFYMLSKSLKKSY